jgi:hypothetical protein
MTITNENRRSVMSTAWSFRREEPTRDFADCLRGAWRWFKGMLKATSALRRRMRGASHVMFSPSLIRSPLARVTSTQRYAGAADSQAARITSRIGA